MAMRLTTENVNWLENKLLDEIDYWGNVGQSADQFLKYIAGVHDMANAVRREIKELGGG